MRTKSTKAMTKSTKAKKADNSEQKPDFVHPDKEHFKRRESQLVADAIGRAKAVKQAIN
jgi:hypothetical protein